jgi:dienelactone hydrolase
MFAETVLLRGHKGNQIDAHIAGPQGAGPFPGIVHTYERAGHAFFAVDREQYRMHAAVDRWKIVFGWFGKYLK